MGQLIEPDCFKLPHQIKVHYLPGAQELAAYANGGCIDTYNYEDVSLKKGEFALINLGFSMQLPKGYDAILLPRSSCFKNHKIMLVNSPGYIDNSYCGTDDIWYAPVVAMEDTFIPAGTRCFQFRLVSQQPNIEFIAVDKLNNPNRGGIGSTGKEGKPGEILEFGQCSKN